MGLIGSEQRMRQPFPVVGILAVAGGLSLLVATDFLPHVTRAFGGYGRFVWLILAALLMLWGLTQVLWRRRSRLGANWLTRLSPHRMTATREGLVYVAIMSVMFIGSVLGRSNMLMLVFAMMIGPWVINGWVAFSMLKRMRVRRSLPNRGLAGTPLKVELEVSNRKWLIGSWLLAARDHIEHPRESMDTATLFLRVPARQSRFGEYTVKFSRRGIYSFGPVRLTTNFPLGLIERSLICDAPAQLIVHPRIGRMTSRWCRDLWDAVEFAERQTARSGLFDDEFQRIREYRPGDNPRAIHWRTTARQGALMVREFDSSRGHELRLILELWQPSRPTVSDGDRVELAISFVATAIHEHLRLAPESEASVVVFGKETIRWDRRMSRDVLFDGLATTEADNSNDFARVVDQTRQMPRRGTRTVIVSSRPRAALMSGLGNELATVMCLSSEPAELSSYFQWEEA